MNMLLGSHAEKMRLCFDLYDLDGSGKISRSEMKSVVTYVESKNNINVLKNILSLELASDLWRVLMQ